MLKKERTRKSLLHESIIFRPMTKEQPDRKKGRRFKSADSLSSWMANFIKGFLSSIVQETWWCFVFKLLIFCKFYQSWNLVSNTRVCILRRKKGFCLYGCNSVNSGVTELILRTRFKF